MLIIEACYRRVPVLPWSLARVTSPWTPMATNPDSRSCDEAFQLFSGLKIKITHQSESLRLEAGLPVKELLVRLRQAAVDAGATPGACGWVSCVEPSYWCWERPQCERTSLRVPGIRKWKPCGWRKWLSTLDSPATLTKQSIYISYCIHSNVYNYSSTYNDAVLNHIIYILFLKSIIL